VGRSPDAQEEKVIRQPASVYVLGRRARQRPKEAPRRYLQPRISGKRTMADDQCPERPRQRWRTEAGMRVKATHRLGVSRGCGAANGRRPADPCARRNRRGERVGANACGHHLRVDDLRRTSSRVSSKGQALLAPRISVRRGQLSVSPLGSGDYCTDLAGAQKARHSALAPPVESRSTTGDQAYASRDTRGVAHLCSGVMEPHSCWPDDVPPHG